MVMGGKEDNALEVDQAIVEGGDGLQILDSIMRESMQRTFSPPESTFTGLSGSSPEKSIRPRKPRR